MISQEEAEIYCRMELKQHNLNEYNVVWSTMKSALGYASPWDKTITLSYDVLRSSAMLTWVMKHEVAHCLDYQERGTFLRNGRNDFHGKNFKKWCRIVGVKSDRLIQM